MTTSDSSARGHDAIFWPLEALHACGEHKLRQTHMYINKSLKKIRGTQRYLSCVRELVPKLDDLSLIMEEED